MKDVGIITDFSFCLKSNMAHRGTVAAYLLTEQLVWLPGKARGQGPVWDAQGNSRQQWIELCLERGTSRLPLGVGAPEGQSVRRWTAEEQ